MLHGDAADHGRDVPALWHVQLADQQLRAGSTATCVTGHAHAGQQAQLRADHGDGCCWVTWFCYLSGLYAIYFGTRGVGMQIVMGLYTDVERLGDLPDLVLHAAGARGGWRCATHRRGHRAVGLGEMLSGAFRCAHREYWLHPDEYPIFNAILSR